MCVSTPSRSLRDALIDPEPRVKKRVMIRDSRPQFLIERAAEAPAVRELQTREQVFGPVPFLLMTGEQLAEQLTQRIFSASVIIVDDRKLIRIRVADIDSLLDAKRT